MNYTPFTVELPRNRQRQRERQLVAALYQAGITIRGGWLIKRDGAAWKHPRIVEGKRKP